jgi:hypothetical protein
VLVASLTNPTAVRGGGRFLAATATRVGISTTSAGIAANVGVFGSLNEELFVAAEIDPGHWQHLAARNER